MLIKSREKCSQNLCEKLCELCVIDKFLHGENREFTEQHRENRCFFYFISILDSNRKYNFDKTRNIKLNKKAKSNSGEIKNE